MEVVLLWLDDFDDILFSVALAWERLSRTVLQIGLASSFALAASELTAVATEWAVPLSYVAMASVAAWGAGGVLRAFSYREPSSVLSTA